MNDQCSRFLVDLYRGARQIPADHFRGWVFEQLHQLFDFDAGIWVTGALAHGPQPQGIHLHRFPLEIIASYEHLRDQGHDAFLPLVIRRAGETLDAGEVLGNHWRSEPMYVRHCATYGMEQVICTAHVDAETRLVTCIFLTKKERNRPFTHVERQTKQSLVPHLVEAYTTSLFVQGGGVSVTRGERSALCDESGVLYQTEPGFSEVLRQQWHRWRGPVLPAEIASILAASPAQYRTERVAVTVVPVYQRFHVTIGAIAVRETLSRREEAVVRALVDGLAYKQIAVRLNISPSTVTKHVNKIYKKLNVQSRAQLARLVGP